MCLITSRAPDSRASLKDRWHMKNIVLVGFMGSGKTAMGRFLSQELGYRFFDTDQEIEAVTGLKMNQIIKKYGKIRFASEEKLVLKRLGAMERVVIATGGNFIQNEESIALLKENGIFVFLKVDEETIIERLSRRKARPFLEKGSIRTIVPRVYGELLPLYEAHSDIVIETSELSMEETAAKILKALEA